MPAANDVIAGGFLVFAISEGVRCAANAPRPTARDGRKTGTIINNDYQRVADERWIDLAKENVRVFFGLMFVVFAVHGAAAYSFFGVKSFTFVAFAILAVLAAVGRMATE
jgi:hypothetical protein